MLIWRFLVLMLQSIGGGYWPMLAENARFPVIFSNSMNGYEKQTLSKPIGRCDAPCLIMYDDDNDSCMPSDLIQSRFRRSVVEFAWSPARSFRFIPSDCISFHCITIHLMPIHPCAGEISSCVKSAGSWQIEPTLQPAGLPEMVADPWSQ